MTSTTTASARPSGIEVKGAYILSAVQTLSEFRKLGESALAAQGVTQLAADEYYPAELRRAIHSAIYDRFGTPGIFWVGLETPDQFVSPADRPGTDMSKALAPLAAELDRASEADLARKLHAVIAEIVRHLNLTIHGSVRGHGYTAGWFFESMGVASELRFHLVNTSTSHMRHEAFSRGIFHFALRYYMPQRLDFTLDFDEARSRDFPGYSSAAFVLRFRPMPTGRNHSLLLAQERSAAREALFKRALIHAMDQEELATKALQELEKIHQYTIESINYAAALQRQQLPKDVRWRTRLPALAALWQPKDLIGGDMWWVDSGRGADHLIRIGLLDCTGHGVPGAMLSLLLTTTLERLDLADPLLPVDQVAHGLQQAIEQSFGHGQSVSDIDNGCDLVLLEVDRSHQTLNVLLGGLGLMLWRRDRAQVEQIVSPRGGLSSRVECLQRLAVRKVAYTRGDRLLLFTDGLTDQIGGSQPYRALGYRRLQQAFEGAAGATVDECVNGIADLLKTWQATQNRRDDVTCLAVDLP